MSINNTLLQRFLTLILLTFSFPLLHAKTLDADTSYEALRIKVTQNFFSKGSQVKQDALRLLEITEKRKDTASFGELNKIIGIIFYFEGNYKQALIYYLKAIAYCKTSKNIREEAAVYNELGTLYRKHQRLDDALDIFDQAYRIFEKLQDSSGLATTLNNSGIVYEEQGKLDIALNKYQEALEIYTLINDRTGMSYSYENIGGIFLLKKNYALAEKPFLLSLQIRREEKIQQGTAMSYHYLGDLYFKMNKLKASEKMFDSCLQISIAIAYPDLEQRVYFSLAELQQAQGHYQQAIYYFKKGTNLKDSLFTIDKQRTLNELQTKYQVEHEQQENKILKQSIDLEKQKSKSQSFKFGFGLMVFILLITPIILVLIRKQKQLKLQNIYKIHEAENNQRKRISHDLHDHVGAQLSYVVSNLEIAKEELHNNITDTRRIHAISEMSKQAIATLRETVWALNTEKITADTFADKFKTFATKMVEVYPEINLSLAESFSNNTELSPNIALHVFRICQEAFSNALKHAKASEIKVYFSSTETVLLEVSIQDNGIGIASGADKKGHYGLQNMQSRASEIGADLQITSSPTKGSKISIKVTKNTTYV